MTTGKQSSTVPTLHSQLHQEDKTSLPGYRKHVWHMIRCLQVSVGLWCAVWVSLTFIMWTALQLVSTLDKRVSVAFAVSVKCSVISFHPLLWVLWATH